MHKEIKHPQALVQQYGAKAGILMYIAEHLPNIPQMPMVVKTPDEDIADFVNRVEKAGIGWNRLVRSSSPLELYGFEGSFLTEKVSQTFKYTLSGVIEKVENSCIDAAKDLAPWDKHWREQVLKKIPVMVVEISPSNYYGTYIKHPNQDDFYLISVSDGKTFGIDDALREEIFFRKPHSYTFYRGIVKNKPLQFKFSSKMMDELEQLLAWHDQLTALPDLDSGWSWQIEFGLDPLMLYQARPFKKTERATFELDPYQNEDIIDKLPTSVGITSKEGILVKVITGVFNDYANNILINPAQDPVAHICNDATDLVLESLIPNLKVNLAGMPKGMLAHSDIAAMRRAEVTVYDWNRLPIDDLPQLNQGDWFRIISDGRRIQLLKE